MQIVDAHPRLHDSDCSQYRSIYERGRHRAAFRRDAKQFHSFIGAQMTNRCVLNLQSFQVVPDDLPGDRLARGSTYTGANGRCRIPKSLRAFLVDPDFDFCVSPPDRISATRRGSETGEFGSSCVSSFFDLRWRITLSQPDRTVRRRSGSTAGESVLMCPENAVAVAFHLTAVKTLYTN
jgi:hypothetical protein